MGGGSDPLAVGYATAHHAIDQLFVFHVLNENAAQRADDHGDGALDATEVGFSAARGRAAGVAAPQYYEQPR